MDIVLSIIIIRDQKTSMLPVSFNFSLQVQSRRHQARSVYPRKFKNAIQPIPLGSEILHAGRYWWISSENILELPIHLTALIEQTLKF